MIKLAHKNGYTIIVSRPSRVEHCFRLADKLGLKIKRPISYDSYLIDNKYKGTELKAAYYEDDE